MGKTMAELNVGKSRYLKVGDLVNKTGEPWAKAEMAVVVVSAEISEYPSQDGKPPEDAFLVYFDEFAKPFGMNLTCRKVIQGICGDEAQWRTEDLAGVRLILFAEGTSMGEGLRIRYNSEAAAESRDQDAPPVDDDTPF
jgi:hypothetical protein